jgi:hypothetical protein
MNYTSSTPGNSVNEVHKLVIVSQALQKLAGCD